MASFDGDGGPNNLVGTPSNDFFKGFAGNDTITGGGGNDNIDAGFGIDTIVLTGNRSQYQFTMEVNANTYPAPEFHFTLKSVDTVASRDGNDTMLDIEFLKFADVTVPWAEVPIHYTVMASQSATVYVFGGAMNDTMTGHAGTDLLLGGLGNDHFDGAGGTDFIAYSPYEAWASTPDIAGGVLVNLGTGIATGPWGIDTFVNVEGVFGTGYDDSLIGSAGGDFLYGDLGNDTLQGGAGNDSMEGGSDADGVDWLLYDGDAADFTVTVADPTGEYDGFFVQDLTGAEGKDLIMGFERIQFNDIGVAYDLDGNAGTSARLIGVLMGAEWVRSPLIENIAISALDSGLSAETLSGLALDALYPTASYAQLSQIMYRNVFHSEPSQPVVDYLVNVMTLTSPAFIAVVASRMAENDASIEFSGLVETGVSFLPII